MSHLPTTFSPVTACNAGSGASVSGTTTITTITRGFRVRTVVQA